MKVIHLWHALVMQTMRKMCSKMASLKTTQNSLMRRSHIKVAKTTLFLIKLCKDSILFVILQINREIGTWQYQ